MKNKRKVEATVEICAGGLHIPEGSSMRTEIVKLGRRQGINVRADLHTFVSSVKYRLKKNQPFSAESALPGKEVIIKKEPARVSKKSYKSLLISVAIIAVLFVLLKTMFTVEDKKPVTAEPRFRVCLTLFRDTVAGGQSVKTFSDD